MEMYHILEIDEADDVYVLLASFVTSEYDQDELSLEGQALLTASKNTDRNVHHICYNLLYRTIK